MSTALTSTPHRRCTPKISRRIPTIPAGNIGGRLVHVSAVDTGPRRNESGVLGGTARRLPRVGPSRSTPRGSGSTGQWLCVLHEGPTYPQYPQPSSSSTPPSCSASRRHRQPPQSPGRPPPTSRSSSSPIRQTHPTSVSDVMTSETLRSHETTQYLYPTNPRLNLRTRGAPAAPSPAP